MMYRYKNGVSRYIVPGGGVEPGETIAQAALREAKEETGLDVVLGPLLYTRPWQGKHIRQREYTFLVTEFRGIVCLGGPEAEANSPDNYYRLVWSPLAILTGNIYPGPIYAATLAFVGQN